MNKITQILIIISFLVPFSELFSIEPCDTVRHCFGARDRALTFTQSSGIGAHYVDVDKTSSIASITDAMTVEMRIKATRQPGVLQFVGGIWGPAEDVNDIWVIYIDENDRITFEINGPNTRLGKTDNTIAQFDFTPYYDSWHFLSCVYDGAGRSAEIYIDGEFLVAASNSSFPAGALRQLQNSELSLQIGSTNALSNNPDNYRTFLGQLDEIRIWNIALTQGDLSCRQFQSLVGTEPGLIMYWRCNQDADVYDICDATPNGNTGRARSGAKCMESNYSHKQTIFFESLDIPLVNNRLKDTIRCDETKTYRFRARDTSDCFKSANVRVYDEFREKYTVSPTRINNMEKNEWYEFEVTINADFTGTINNRIAVWETNNCYYWANYWMDITRITESTSSLTEIDFGLLKANCIETPYKDTVITICNTTSDKSITVNSFTTQFPEVYRLLTPLPATIPPNGCIDIRIRFETRNVSGIYDDIFEIETSDACEPIKNVSIIGSIREVFAVYQGYGESKLDSIDFGKECLEFASQPINFRWQNLFTEEEEYNGDKIITVEDIILPSGVITPSMGFPIVLEPGVGYQPEFFRYYPITKGAFQDSIIFIVKSEDCTIRYPIYVKGEGVEVEVEFTTSNLSFGDIYIGQEGILTATIYNNSDQEVNLSLYLKRGEAFYFNGSRTAIIPAKSSRNVNMIFRPTLEQVYTDELCFFDNICFESACIPLDGRGILDRFQFEPHVMETENVIGCQSTLDTIRIINNSSVTQDLSSFFLDDPSGRFSLFSPANFPSNAILNPGESVSFILNYDPNDLTRDRADRSFIRFKTSDGHDWHAKLYGRSITPSLYVTDRTTYGTIELGETLIRTLIVENTSPIPIRIDSIKAPNGFNRIYPAVGFEGTFLAPRDTFHLLLEFAPVEAKYYSGDVIVYTNEPCVSNYWGFVEGSAEIIPLEIPLTLVSFGFVNPCDCELRTINLINRSEVFPMSIDSVFIDGQGIIGAAPQYFSWSSYYYEQNGSNLPYEIPPFTIDTLKILYCPESPSNRDSIDHSARVQIFASGTGWNNQFSSYLTGKRALIMEIKDEYINFPPTRVDTLSIPQTANIYVPGIDLNPSGIPLRIDSITFDPPERVFSIDNISTYPIYISSLDSLLAEVQFKPRAVRDYFARMVIHIGAPCEMKDTTILCFGSGFAPAFGLSFEFENPDSDTMPIFRGVFCDTINVPIYSSRKFPADVVNIDLVLVYDTSKVDLANIETKYLSQTCQSYLPNINIDPQNELGSRIAIKNFCKIDSLDPIFIAKFIPKWNIRDTFDLSLDSLKFDTEEVILYEIIVETPIAQIIIDLTELSFINLVDFGTINVLDCNDQELQIVNTGDNPTDIYNLFDLPEDVVILQSIPDFGNPILPGDTAYITLRYCPTKKDTIQSEIFVNSSFPCIVIDTTQISGSGFAPEYLVSSDISMNFSIPDTLSGALGDTLIIPIYFEKDMSVEYNGTTYWMQDLSFNLDFLYNKRALKILDISNNLNSDFESAIENGKIELKYSNVNDLHAGMIAEMKFLVVVPDSVITSIGIGVDSFESQSIMFYDIIPYSQNAYFRTIGRCNLTYFEFTDKTAELKQNRPNPWSQSTIIEFTTDEKSAVELLIFNAKGELVLKPLDGSLLLESGSYNVEIDSQDFPAGIYFYRIKAGQFQAQKSMIIVR